MKLRIKRILSGMVAIGVALSLSTVAFAKEQKVSAFDDVPADHWAYTSIMAMTSRAVCPGGRPCYMHSEELK